MAGSQHFTVEELTHSNWAVEHNVPNPCPVALLPNLTRSAQLMEQVRALYKLPISVISCYRNPRVNRGVGGSPTSAHMQALAVDFRCNAFGSYYMQALAIAASKDIVFDQLILEPSWVHIGLAEAGKKPRGQVLTKFSGDPKYYPGLHIKKP